MLKHPEVLDFQIDDPRWRHIPHICARLEKAAVLTLAHLPKPLRFPSKLTLLLTKDAHIRRLNHDFRGMDKPTNVLSFPQFHTDELVKLTKIQEPIHVGDIAISYQCVVDEAERDHKMLINHVVHLLIHGILHLFGYDHISTTDAVKMERLEKKVMDELGLPDPYTVLEKKPQVRAIKAKTTAPVKKRV